MLESFLPFYNERRAPVNMLMIHCSAQHTAAEMVEVLRAEELSCHYIIDFNGDITQVAPEDKRAWHGGFGSWRDVESDVNSHSIGIELCHLTLGQTPYDPRQIAALTELGQDIIRRYHIKPQYIVGHSDCSPTRKPDPGKAFPWQTLAQNDVGLWYDVTDAGKVSNNDVRALLQSIGYATASDTEFHASQYAFARHFVPQLIADDFNIHHLVENVFPPQIDLASNPDFLNILKAVNYTFNQREL